LRIGSENSSSSAAYTTSSGSSPVVQPRANKHSPKASQRSMASTSRSEIFGGNDRETAIRQPLRLCPVAILLMASLATGVQHLHLPRGFFHIADGQGRLERRGGRFRKR